MREIPYWRWTGRGGGPRLAVMADVNNLPRRGRRYARASPAMGGLAARLAGKRYLGLNLDRGRHAADLKSALGNLKGPLMKVAQLLATIPAALPPPPPPCPRNTPLN